MKMKDYLIAVDLDGTLIVDFDDYDLKSIQLLKELAKDNYVVIATGRPLRSSKYYYNLMELKTPIINYNGALIQNPNDKSFPKQALHINKDLLIKFIEDNNNIIKTVFCEIDDNIYLDRQYKYAYPYLHSEGGNLTVGSLKNKLPTDPNGAIVFAQSGYENHLIEYVENEFKDKINIRIWHAKEIVIAELYNPLTNKANALKKVCDFYNISNDKTIAFGDGNNDIEMIKFVKYGVAMANSVTELFDFANFKTKKVTENGVYCFLKNMEKIIV